MMYLPVRRDLHYTVWDPLSDTAYSYRTPGGKVKEMCWKKVPGFPGSETFVMDLIEMP